MRNIMRNTIKKINNLVIGKTIKKENEKSTAEKLKGLHYNSNIALAVFLALPSILMCVGYNKLYLIDPENPLFLPATIFAGVFIMILMIRALLTAYTIRELEIKTDLKEVERRKALQNEVKEKQQFELNAELNAEFEKTLEMLKKMKAEEKAGETN